MKRVGFSLLVIVAAGCGTVSSNVESPPVLDTQSAEVSAPAPPAAIVGKALDVAQSAPNPPQLAKTATLSLEVKDATTSAQQAISWTRKARGEMLGLEDNGATGAVRRLTLELQVPAAQLDEVLASLITLGTLENRQISAEDVSSQLVDLGARLRNLRKSEELLLKIMGRSGSVGDVLKVTQELSQVREQIEQLDAQRVNVQNRVRYSRIRLFLTTPTVSTPGRSVPERLGETWAQATRTLGDCTLGLVELCLWLLVFSPYVFLPGLILWLVRRRLRPPQTR